MAVISTIKPDGTGDFTTLALWADWADGDPSGTSNAAYWAECYKGGNLGAVNVTGWSVSATADNHPKIYAAAGQGHGGDVTDGAYIQTGSANAIEATAGIAGLHIDGIRIDVTSTSHKAIDMASTSDDSLAMLYQTVENCYIHSTTDGYDVGIYCGNVVQDNGAVTKNVVIRNNIIEVEYGATGMFGLLNGLGIVIGAVAYGGSTASTTNAWIHNNTICSRDGDTDDYATAIGWYFNTGKTLNLVLENNYLSMEDASPGVTGAQRHIHEVVDGATLNITVRNNGQPGTEDITSYGLNDDTVFPGHATATNAVADDQFTDRDNGDYSLKETSVLKDAGKVPAAYGLSYISVASEDVLGTSRPQYTAWDIGAHELLEPEAEAEGSSSSAATGSGRISLSSQDVARNIIQSNHVDAASISYLKEIALGFEYGSASEIIRKWPSNVYIKAHWVNDDGSSATPDSDDAAQLAAVVSELNDLINTVEIELINDGSSNVCTSDTHSNSTSGCSSEPVNGKTPNINVFFTTQARYTIIESNYVEGNVGFFYANYGGAKAGLTRVNIYVKDSASLATRKHLIREEITQAMGLGKDSDTYTDSIFRQSGGVNTDYYTEIDRNIIRMLYDSRVRNGMDADRVEKALTQTSSYFAGRDWSWSGNINSNPRKSLSTLDNRFINDGRIG